MDAPDRSGEAQRQVQVVDADQVALADHTLQDGAEGVAALERCARYPCKRRTGSGARRRLGVGEPFQPPLHPLQGVRF